MKQDEFTKITCKILPRKQTNPTNQRKYRKTEKHRPDPILNGGRGGGIKITPPSPPKKNFFEIVKNLNRLTAYPFLSQTKFSFACLLKISIKNHAYLLSYSYFVKCLRHADSRICALLLLYVMISFVFLYWFLVPPYM